MIHYNVWFTAKEGAEESLLLDRCREFLKEFQSRGLIHEFQLLKNRGESGESHLPKFQAMIKFRDGDQFTLPFEEVRQFGIHAGQHGFIIENVEGFTVEVFEEL